MAHSSSRWIPLIVLAFAAPLAACGGTSTPAGTSAPGTSSPATSAPTPTVAPVATTAAAPSCPSGGTVGSALGTTLPNPDRHHQSSDNNAPSRCDRYQLRVPRNDRERDHLDPHGHSGFLHIQVQRQIPGGVQAGVRSWRCCSVFQPASRRWQEQPGSGRGQGVDCRGDRRDGHPGDPELDRGAGQLAALAATRPAFRHRRPGGRRRSSAPSPRATGGNPAISHVTAPHPAPMAAPAMTSVV